MTRTRDCASLSGTAGFLFTARDVTARADSAWSATHYDLEARVALPGLRLRFTFPVYITAHAWRVGHYVSEPQHSGSLVDALSLDHNRKT